MDTPVIITHFGDSYFLPHVLSQLKKSNPQKRIVLLGDSSNKFYQGLVDWFDIRDYSLLADKFSKNYHHLSPNNRKYELFCFVRWFAILEFMKRNIIPKAWCLDSDVMVYDDLTKTETLFSSKPMSISDVSGGCCLINDINILENLCQKMMETYEDESTLTRLREHLVNPIHPKIACSVSDMYFFADLKMKLGDEIGDFSKITNSSIFDSNIYLQEGLVMNGDIKKVCWDKGQPFGLTMDGKRVDFVILHFASKFGKSLIKHHYPYLDLALSRKQIIIHFLHTNFLSRLVRKLFK